VDDRADEIEAARLREAALSAARDPHGDARARRAAEPIDRLLQRHVERRFVVDLRDAVAREEAERAVADRDHDAEAAELAAGRHLHLFVDVGREQHGVRVEGAQHAVDGRVLDLAQLDVLVGEVLLQELEDVAEAVGERPRRVDVVDVELLALIVDLDRQRRRALRVVDEHGRDRALDRVEAAEQHVAVPDPVRVDVAVVHLGDGAVEHAELAEIVRLAVTRRLRRRRAVEVDVEPVADRPDEGEHEGAEDGEQGTEGQEEGGEFLHAGRSV
jgi:hypothetical protein